MSDKRLSVIDSFRHALKRFESGNGSVYLCLLVEDGVRNYNYSFDTHSVLRKELLNLDEVFWKEAIRKDEYSREFRIEKGYAFWSITKRKIRVRFLKKIIKKLEDENRG